MPSALLDTMKINDPNLVGSGVTSTGVSKSGRTSVATGKPEAGQISSNGDGDGVQLSDLAQRLQSLDADSPEREAKVQALAKAYADGSHSVDPDKTAAGIIDDALAG
jgi:flagellar biosynthesis anti-sigma factor FlgM